MATPNLAPPAFRSIGEANKIARTAWIDVARGIGIILVVYGHALRGLIAAKWLEQGGWRTAQDHAIYAFHMPLFFLLAGLFVERGLARGHLPFIENKLRTIVYPYFLWSLINGGLQLALPGEVNLHVTAANLARVLWRPIDQFWFLYALLICQLIALACLPRMWSLLVVTAICVPLSRWPPLAMVLQMGFDSLPFFVVGIILARSKLTRQEPTTAIITTLLTVGWISYAVLLILGPGQVELAWRYAIALCGCAGSIAVAMLIGSRARLLSMLGRASMAIYVSHVMVTAGVRVAAKHLSTELNPILLLAISTVLGLLLPLLLFLGSVRCGLSAWLGLGRPLDRGPPAGALLPNLPDPRPTAELLQ